MTRDTAINIIKRTIEQKYGRKTLSDICKIEGWSIFAVSRALNSSAGTIPKNLLEFAGLEMVKEPIYRRIEK